MSNAAIRDAPPGSYVANHAAGTLAPPLSHAILARRGRRIFDRHYLVAAAMSPRRRRAVADADRDDRKRRRFGWPRRPAVADDDQQVDRTTRSFDEGAQTDPQVGAAAANQLDLAADERALRLVDRGIAAGNHDVRAVPELTRQTGQLRHRPGQLRIAHRARAVDQEARSRPWLVEARHQELAVGGLTPM